MTKARYVNGLELPCFLQKEALAKFAHRYTGNHVPDWVRKSESPVFLPFRDDNEWLANTEFAVNAAGDKLDERVNYCHSSPTWPNNPELRPSKQS